MFLVGVFVGFVLGFAVRVISQSWLSSRDEQVKKNVTKLLLQESLPTIKTKELLNELSKRDDIHS